MNGSQFIICKQNAIVIRTPSGRRSIPSPLNNIADAESREDILIEEVCLDEAKRSEEMPDRQ